MGFYLLDADYVRRRYLEAVQQDDADLSDDDDDDAGVSFKRAHSTLAAAWRKFVQGLSELAELCALLQEWHAMTPPPPAGSSIVTMPPNSDTRAQVVLKSDDDDDDDDGEEETKGQGGRISPVTAHERHEVCWVVQRLVLVMLMMMAAVLMLLLLIW